MRDKAYFQLIMGFIALLFLGVAYAWSLFVSPLELEFGWTREMTSMIFTISMICFCLGGILGGIVSTKLPYRTIIISMALALFAGFAACARVEKLWQIYVAYGVICGLSIGILYNVIIIMINQWFENNIGFSTGILTMGFGIGSFLLGFLISGSNKTFGWRNTYYILGVIFLILFLAEAWLLKLPKHHHHKIKKDTGLKQLSIIQMLKERTFQFYYLWAALISTVGLGIFGHVSQISNTPWNTLFGSVIAVGVVSISNGASRMFFGHSYDRIGRFKTMQVISLFLVIGVTLLYLSLTIKLSILMILGFFFIGSSYGGLSPCNSAFVREYYGSKHYAKNFSIATSGGVPAALIGPYIMGNSVKQFGNYNIAIILMVLFALITVVLKSSLDKSDKHYKKSLIKNQVI